MKMIQNLKRDYFAGSQMWFSKEKRFGRQRRLHDYGCGVIALMDLAVYCGMEKKAADTENYLRAVDQMERKWMHIIPGFGISPYIYSVFANRYLRTKAVSCKLHRVWLFGNKKKKSEKLKQVICGQLQKDVPVIFAAGPLMPVIGKNKRIVLYRRNADKMTASGHAVKSHYMTIVGILQMSDGECYMKLASWGQFWYMKLSDYLEYEKYTIFFTNAVYIAG